MKWFKFYGQDYLSDPKILALTACERSCWLTLLAYGSVDDNGLIKFLSEFQLMAQAGINPNSDEWEETKGVLKKLENLKMIQIDNDDIAICNWNKRQESYLTDAERSQNYRKRKKESDERHADVTLEENRIDKKRIDTMSEKSDAPSQFDTFWNSYPKKELKKKSQEIWKRKKLDQHLPEILAFIEKAKITDRWKKGFVKQPTTFLNNESWNDDLSSYGDNTSPPEKSYTDNGWNASKETHEQFLERTKKIALEDQPVSTYAKELSKTLKV